MKLAVFDSHRVGVVEGDTLYDVTSAVPDAGPQWPPVYMSRLIADWAVRRPQIEAARRAATGVPVASVTLLAPNPCPVHVFAAPVNYAKHVGEIGARSVSSGKSPNEMCFFMKATSSIVGASGTIVLPKDSARRFDHESELAVIIGRTARHVPRAQAMEHVFGYACLMDLTMRIEPGIPQEERVTRKSFESFTPFGPYLVTADEVTNPHNLRNRLWVNDELRQDARTSSLIVDIPGLIEMISSVCTLYPGDVIATGTPEGVGPIAPGDTVRIEIEQIGTMSLPVRHAEVYAPRRF